MGQFETKNDRRSLSWLWLVALLLVSSSQTWAAFNPIQGFVPRFPGARPAVDLVHDGEILRPEDALALAESGFDLSTLEPDETSDLWKNTQPSGPSSSTERTQAELTPAADDLDVDPAKPVEYLGAAASQPGNFRFIIQQTDSSGTPRSFAVFASKTIHQMLLRKNLLRKLGYVIPKTQWVSTLTIQFPNSIEKDAFKVDLAQKTYGDPGRWINTSLSSGETLVLNDVVVVENQDQIYNLSNGFLDAARIRGRRLLNALLIPYALVSSNEQSMNLFPWNAGQILGDNVLFPYEHADRFTPSFEDARWIARKILALSRKDWEDIVSEARLPDAVGKLLVEKLISRRNTLGPLLKLQVEPSWYELAFDPQISSGQDLIKGEITRKEFPGYATHFSAGDPDHPFDGRQIGLMFKSNLISSGVTTALSLLNQIPIFSTDIDQKIGDHRQKIFIEQIERSLKDGSSEKIPLAAYVFPTWNANLIFSRDLAVGSYMGADNLLQLADTFGYQVSLGAYLSVDGLPTPVEAHASGGVTATRMFTHLRPVKTVEAAMKYPFKNAIVSRLVRNAGDMLMDKVDENFSKLTPGEQQQILKDNLKSFTEDFEVGSSLMISDGIDVGVGIGATWKPYELIAVGADLGKHRIILRRLHILRKSATEFQVYQSRGKMNDFSVSIRLEARIPLSDDTGYQVALEKLGIRALKQISYPILSFKLNKQRGKVSTDFFRFELDSETMGPLALREKMGALASAMSDRNTELLRASSPPYKAEFDFTQTLQETDFLFLDWNKVRNRTHLSIKTPGGSEKKLFREYLSKTFGLDIEREAGMTLSAALKALTLLPVDLASAQSSNPGFTYLGRAKNRIWTYEEEQSTTSEPNERYVKMEEVWNGWAIRRARAERILQSINERLGVRVFPKTALIHTDKILLYQIRLETHLYDSAINYASRLSDEKVRELFIKYRRADNDDHALEISELEEYEPEIINERETIANSFVSLLTKAKKDLKKSGTRRTAKSLINAFALASAELTQAGFSALVGGEDNYLITSRIDGFRVGDEAGDRAILGNTIGSAASAKHSAGPFMNVQQKSGMTNGELLLGWMLRRAL